MASAALILGAVVMLLAMLIALAAVLRPSLTRRRQRCRAWPSPAPSLLRFPQGVCRHDW